MKHHVRNGIDYFEFESFSADSIQQHAIFGRNGGVSPAPFASLNLSSAVKDDPDNVTTNQHRAFGLFQRQWESLAHAHLIHGNGVVRVTQDNQGILPRPKVDALITNQSGCGLTMNFADCTPIFIYDPVNHAIGLGHAGWQGCIVDLPGAMVRAMQTQFGSDPAQLRAGIGPTISVAHYEVDEPLISAVHGAFPNHIDELLIYPGNGSGIAHKSERPHFDLERANAINLQRAGVHQIELSGFCTAQRTDLFFSHRAEKGKTGRFGSVFILK
jgi:YfiH family protein